MYYFFDLIFLRKYEINEIPKCTTFGMKSSKSHWFLGLRPSPHWGNLRRSPDPLVVMGFLPSAIAASCLRRLKLPRRVRPDRYHSRTFLPTSKLWLRH